VRGHLRDGAACAEERYARVGAGVARKLEAHPGFLAQDPHGQEHEVRRPEQDRAVEVEAAVVVERRVIDEAGDQVDQSAVLIHEVRDEAKRGPLREDRDAAHLESRGVRHLADARRDLRDREARTARRHEAVRHQVREAAEETRLPLAPTDAVISHSYGVREGHRWVSLGLRSTSVRVVREWRGIRQQRRVHRNDVLLRLLGVFRGRLGNGHELETLNRTRHWKDTKNGDSTRVKQATSAVYPQSWVHQLAR